MSEVTNKQNANAPFSNGIEKVKVEYDFAKDGGAVGILDLVEMKFNAVLKSFYAKTITALTSDGAATLDVGIKTDAKDALIKAKAFTDFSIGSVVYDKTNQIIPLKCASGKFLSMEIGTAALTAGKIEFVFEFEKF